MATIDDYQPWLDEQLCVATELLVAGVWLTVGANRHRFETEMSWTDGSTRTVVYLPAVAAIRTALDEETA